MGMNLDAYSREQFPGLHLAVEKALAKERAERGFSDEEKDKVTYIAILMIGKTKHQIKNTNLAVFKLTMAKYQKSFPNIPVHLYTHTELQSDNSTENV